MPSDDEVIHIDPANLVITAAVAKMLPGGRAVLVEKGSTEGFKVACYMCHRIAYMPFEIERGQGVLCPSCQAALVKAADEARIAMGEDN